VKKKTVSSASAIFAQNFLHDDAEMQKLYAEARQSALIARQILKWRTESGLTQKELAKLVGTASSVICRLEDDSYTGHSVSMLSRIAAALRLQVGFMFYKSFGPIAPQRTISVGRLSVTTSKPTKTGQELKDYTERKLNDSTVYGLVA